MQIFKKNNKKDKEKKSKKIKKKTKIGFKPKNIQKKNNKEQKSNYNKDKKTDEDIDKITSINKEEKINKKDEKKKKNILKKEINGQPVFLEDTGEKIGTIFDTIVDQDNKILGYKIKDEKSDSVLSFSVENFDETKKGFVFIPGWYTNSLKIIEKLEFKDKISPELTALLFDDTVTNKELYDIFVKHDDDMVKYIDDAKSVRETITNRLNILEKQRYALKDDLMDLTEKRLIKDIDRKQFSEDVTNHRRKVNILDININKCKKLLKRLDKTSFGVLGKNNLSHEIKYKVDAKSNLIAEKINNNIKNQNDDIFKDKYYTLKQKYDELEEKHNELKMAIDELLIEEEL